MTMIDWLLVLVSLLALYFIAVLVLKRVGFFEKYNLSLYGPALMFRTKRGIGFLKRLAKRKRFWKSYGNFGIGFCIIAMICMVSVFVFQFWMLIYELQPQERANLPGLRFALALPGINPVLPLEYTFYILLAFVVAIIVHEFSHGILSIAERIKVKSLGLLYFIIPVGAFCEPDEKELEEAKIGKRMRVYSAGPLSNFAVAFAVLLLFSFVFMSAVQPIGGAHVLSNFEDSPAGEISLSTGSVITSLNDTKLDSPNEFSTAISNTSPNQTVNITYIYRRETFNKQVELTNKYDFYVEHDVDKEKLNKSLKNNSFLGVNFVNVDYFVSSLKRPISYDFPGSFLVLYGLPFLGYQGYNPIASPFNEALIVQGPLSAIPTPLFWAITTALFWILWLNLLVGLFNVLPMGPLDGGFLFKDAIGAVILKLRKNISEERKEKLVQRISFTVSLIVLFLVLMPFFAKYI
ncbi:MAG: site-2 protease family protein [Candidatus Thermoplasmatota archaeon]